MSKPKSHHFDMGNSTQGHVGYCARIIAETQEEAAKILKRVLPDSMKVQPVGDEVDNEAVEYIEVYFNSDIIDPEDAVEDDDEDDEV